MKTYGPYVREDGRQIIIVNGKTMSYPKYLLEQKIGRPLTIHETCDHIDGDISNNDPSNLRVLSREQNAELGARFNKNTLGFKQSEEHKRSGEKNGMSKITKEKVNEYRELHKVGKITKRQIIKETGLSRKAVENFLNFVTYK